MHASVKLSHRLFPGARGREEEERGREEEERGGRRRGGGRGGGAASNTDLPLLQLAFLMEVDWECIINNLSILRES